MVCQSFGSVGDTPPPQALSLFTAVSLALISVIATTGNVGIVLIILKDPLKKLHNSFHYFLLNLALSDLLLAIVTMPIGVASLVQEYLKHEKVLTKAFHVTLFMSGTASLLSLIALSVDRYIAVKHHIKYKRLLTGYRCTVVCVCIWVFSFSFPFLYFAWDYIGYLMFFAHSAIFVALVILIGTLCRAKMYLRKRSRQTEENAEKVGNAGNAGYAENSENVPSASTKPPEPKSSSVLERKISRVYIMILSFFVTIYVPSVVMTYILHFCTHCDCTVRHVLRDLAFLLISANSCVNPFIYAFRNGTFRGSVTLVFCRSEKKSRRSRRSSNNTSLDTLEIGCERV